jgi:hypothetical protein
MTPARIRDLLDLITEVVIDEDANWQEKRLEIVREASKREMLILTEFAAWFERRR